MPPSDRDLYDPPSSFPTPAQLRDLDPADLATVAAGLRSALLRSVSRTGGHLASNLGVVELTLALHHVFDTPRDALV